MQDSEPARTGRRGRTRHRPGRRTRAAAGAVAAVLAAGALAACDATGGNATAPGSSAVSRQASPKPEPVWDTSPSSVAAAGDSITTAFDACTVLADCPEASWATGSRASVESLAQRLLGRQASARSWNFAVSGARMADLPAQVEKAVDKEPGLLTVLMGANDACREDVAYMTPVADFRRDFARAMRTVREESPKTQVYVASVPDLKRLWSEGRTSPEAVKVWGLGICASMLADPGATDARANARRDSVRERVVAYNTVLREVCAADLRCRYDGGAVFGYRFTGKQISPWDWFHPSLDGQARLAEIAYRDVTSRKGPA